MCEYMILGVHRDHFFQFLINCMASISIGERSRLVKPTNGVKTIQHETNLNIVFGKFKICLKTH